MVFFGQFNKQQSNTNPVWDTRNLNPTFYFAYFKVFADQTIFMQYLAFLSIFQQYLTFKCFQKTENVIEKSNLFNKKLFFLKRLTQLVGSQYCAFVRDVLYATYMVGISNACFDLLCSILHTRQWHQVKRVIVEKLIDSIFRDIARIFRR